MASASLTLTGDKALMAKLNRLGEAGKGRALGDALTAGAQPVVNEWKARAMVLSGTYRRSVHAGDPDVSGDSASIEVGTDLPYPRRLEYGYDGTDSLGRTYHQPARPHIRPAVEASKGAAQREVAAVLRQKVAEAVG